MQRRSINIILLIVFVAVMIIAAFLVAFNVIGYAAASLIIIASLIGMALVAFEKSRMRCKMLVLIATMSAIATVGRVVFAWAPNVTLSTGIIILAGMSMGGLAGFMTGALSMLVSNILLGHGLWTVWQILLCGSIGAVASLLKNKDRILLYIYAIFVGFAYGFIMDIFTLITVYDVITPERFLLVWGASFYFDLAHSISTLITVICLNRVVADTIERRLG